MKKFAFVFIALLVFILSGCTRTPDEVIEKTLITDQTMLGVGKEMKIDLPDELSAGALENVTWKLSDENMALLVDDTLIAVDKGVVVVTAENENYKYQLTVTIYSEVEYNAGLFEITTYIRQRMNTVGDTFFDIIEEIDGYEFDIVYTAREPEILDLNGHYVRGLIDKFTYIDATINYMGIESQFVIQVKIEMIPDTEQKSVIEGYIQEEIKDIVSMENGVLPSYFSIYDLNILWSANLPGVIGFDYSLHPAYDESDVTLYARYLIGREEETMEVKYISKGVKAEDKADYISRVMGQLVPEVSGKWVNTIYGNDEEIIQDFIYPDATTKLRPGSGKTGQKMPGGPQYVVIHDTGMSGPDDTAEGLNRFIHGNANSPDGRVASWHFSIDEKETYQHVPTDEIAWHAGDGGAAFGSTYFNTSYNAWSIGGGNQNGIGIETCINSGGNYELTLKRTAKLTASLLHEYGLTLDRVKTHNDFSGKNCPAVIRSQKGLWESFMRDVEIEYFLMSIADDVTVSWENSHPEVIRSSGLIVKPVNDTTVNLTLNLTLDEQNYTFNYTTLVKGLETSEKLTRVSYDLLINYVPNRASANIVLPTANELYGALIVWTSDNESVLSSSGVYTKPSKETIVKLTAVIKIGSDEMIKTYNVIVN